MPRGNGTGPNGMGPMTGRGAGYCGGGGAPGFVTGGAGLGFGRGCGGRGGQRGRHGRRNMFNATGLTGRQRAAMEAVPPPTASDTPTADLEKQSLESEVQVMQSQLDAMKQRLTDLEAEKA